MIGADGLDAASGAEIHSSATAPWSHYLHTPDNRRIGAVRYPRLIPKDPACAKSLQERTLTDLDNERPTWLDLVHKKLDEVIAYGVMHIKAPNTPKSAGFVVRTD